MKLYGGPTSPFVRKAKLWSLELGLDVETVPTNVTPAEVNEDYRKKNPLVQVPALELDDGFVLSDSHIICDHLARAGGVDLFPAEGRARDEALQTYALLNGATEALVQCVYETIRRPAELKWDAYLTGRFAKVESAADMIAETGGELFNFGEKLTYNQVVLVCLIGYANHRFAEINIIGRPALGDFIGSLNDRASVLETMPV
ncbi:MAG: glutathione S-transferase family protein [Pseudomonadota bacterium]